MLKVCSRVQSVEEEGGALRATQAVLVVYEPLSQGAAGRRTGSGQKS